MKSKIQRSLPIFLVIGTSIALFGCGSQNANRSVNFHIGDKTINVVEENNAFAISDVEIAHKRFVGWSTDQSKGNVFTNDLSIEYGKIKEFFKSQNSLDLYGIYVNVLSVSFVLDETTTYELDEEYDNKVNVPKHDKEGFLFKGWSLKEDGSSIDLGDLQMVSYSNVYPVSNGSLELSFYPVYISKENSNIKLYEYSAADEMAEIHIETKDHLPIDDASLIKPDEHKGKDGELPVYDYVGATITVDHCEDQYALNNIAGKVKVRGNYTSSYAKKPIRIKFDSKQKMLGLNSNNALKNWVLLANWKDTSLLRDAAAFYLGNALVESDGYYTSDFRFVKVYLNDAYNGVYLLVEQQEVNANRINILESKSATDSEKTGYFLEFDGYYQNEPENQRFTVNYNSVKTGTNGFTVSNDIMNDNQLNFIKKATQNIWNVVYDACKVSHSDLSKNPYHTIDENGDYVVDNSITTAKAAIDKVVDINSLVDLYIMHELLEDRDIGFSSFYFAIDFSSTGTKKLTYTAPWDFDYAVGNNTFENAMRANLNIQKMISDGRMTQSGRKYKLKATTTLTKSDFTFTNKDALYCPRTDNPWFLVFSNEQWLWDMIYARWSEASEVGVFSSLLTMIDTMEEKYTADFNENFTKWSQSLGITLSALQPDIVTYFVNQKQAADYLRIWLEARIEGLGSALKNKASK